MAKIEVDNLRKISTIASNYRGRDKTGVSPQYMRRFLASKGIDIIDIDGVHFVDLSTLPDEIKKNLKK